MTDWLNDYAPYRGTLCEVDLVQQALLLRSLPAGELRARLPLPSQRQGATARPESSMAQVLVLDRAADMTRLEPWQPGSRYGLVLGEAGPLLYRRDALRAPELLRCERLIHPQQSQWPGQTGPYDLFALSPDLLAVVNRSEGLIQLVDVTAAEAGERLQVPVTGSGLALSLDAGTLWIASAGYPGLLSWSKDEPVLRERRGPWVRPANLLALDGRLWVLDLAARPQIWRHQAEDLSDSVCLGLPGGSFSQDSGSPLDLLAMHEHQLQVQIYVNRPQLLSPLLCSLDPESCRLTGTQQPPFGLPGLIASALPNHAQLRLQLQAQALGEDLPESVRALMHRFQLRPDQIDTRLMIIAAEPGPGIELSESLRDAVRDHLRGLLPSNLQAGLLSPDPREALPQQLWLHAETLAAALQRQSRLRAVLLLPEGEIGIELERERLLRARPSEAPDQPEVQPVRRNTGQLSHPHDPTLPSGWLGIADPLNSRVLKLNELLEPVWFLDTGLMQIHRPTQVRWPDAGRVVVLDGETGQVSCWNDRAQQEWALDAQDAQWSRMELLSSGSEALSLLLLDQAQGRLTRLSPDGRQLWASQADASLGHILDFALERDGRLRLLQADGRLLHYDFAAGLLSERSLPGKPESLALGADEQFVAFDGQAQSLLHIHEGQPVRIVPLALPEGPWRIQHPLALQWGPDDSLCLHDPYRLLLIGADGRVLRRSLMQQLRTDGRRNQAPQEAFSSRARNEASLHGSQLSLGDLLRRVPLFASAPEAFFAALTDLIRTRAYNRGDLIVRAGEPGEEMFLIRQGQTQVLGDGGREVVASMGPGEIFGEVSLMLGVPRNATIRAGSYCELFSLRRGDLDRLLLDYPAQRQRLVQLARERQTQQQLRFEHEQSRLRERIDALIARPRAEAEAPAALAAPADDLTLWVRQSEAGQLANIRRDGKVLSLLDEELGLLQPIAACETSAGLWVLDVGLNELQLLDLVSKRLHHCLSDWNDGLLDQPRDLVAAPDGSFWVVNAGSGRLLQLDPEGAPLQELALGRLLTSLQLLENGNLLVSDLRLHTVSEYTPSGKEIWRYGTPRRFGRDENLLFGPEFAMRLPNGHTLIADTGNSRVLELGLDGRIHWSLISAAGLLLPRPTRCLRLPSGDTLVEHSNRMRWLEVSADLQDIWHYELPAKGFKL